MCLTSLNKKISELRFRIARQSTTQIDAETTQCLANKVQQALRAEHYSVSNLSMFDDAHLLWIQERIQKDLANAKLKEKRARINSWKKKMQESTQNNVVSGNVYKWISSKIHSSPANLVHDSDNNIVFNPNEAIDIIHDRWDDVFSVNASFAQPHALLATIWPYVKEYRTPITLPKVTGEDLAARAKHRKINAAAGLDGWRTPEVQLLPKLVMAKIADFFNEVEEQKRSLPKILCCAKQIFLNKNTSSDPMQKRIISILPCFAILFSGLRYHQLTEWQQQVFPVEIVGGIKNRLMSDVPATIRSELDLAHRTNDHVAGIKIDKAKAFDKLIPSVVVMLMVAFGLPPGLANYIHELYSKLAKFTVYQGWSKKNYITTCNGMLQGCSLSILAMNLHQLVWTILLRNLPDVFSRSYIDDSYLWVKLNKFEQLDTAVQITRAWDYLTGQSMNVSKCEVWSSSANGRKLVREAFPEMKLALGFDVLGVRIQTTLQSNFAWPKQKTQKLCREILLIGSLPCPVQTKEVMIASKIIPQMSYAPRINCLPKDDLKATRSKISYVLGKNRPHWRSRWRMMGLIHKPFRSEPEIARAYSAVLCLKPCRF